MIEHGRNSIGMKAKGNPPPYFFSASSTPSPFTDSTRNESGKSLLTTSRAP